jgi:hypothetical protein
MSPQETAVTPFGLVTSDHLSYNVQRGWLSESSRQDIPLSHVTSVRLEIRRHPVFAIILVLAALACQAADPIGILIAIIPLAFAVLLLWGSPLVRVNTIDGELPPTSGLPWTRPEAEWFVAAVEQCRRRCTAEAELDQLHSVSFR